MFMFFLQFSQAEEQYDVGQVGIFMMITFTKVCLLLFIFDCSKASAEGAYILSKMGYCYRVWLVTVIMVRVVTVML